jgi:hypothetical protein
MARTRIQEGSQIKKVNAKIRKWKAKPEEESQAMTMTT